MSIEKKTAVSFERLVASIRQAHEELTAQASRAVNASLTLRNWLIGLYIEEYERRGVDRQQYGEKLLDRLAESLTGKGVSRCDRRELYRYRQLYLTYPQIVEAVPPQLTPHLRGLLPGPEDSSPIVESPAPQFRLDGQTLLSRLSFTHLAELVTIEVELKLGAFSYENIGQLNTYVSWYRKNMMVEGDNPPVGILLCTQKDHALVEYALAGLENGIFVSKYLLELPRKEEMQRFIEEQLAGALPHGGKVPQPETSASSPAY